MLHAGDYEKLWGAVTGGRGTGRGKKRTKSKDKEAVPIGFGNDLRSCYLVFLLPFN
jgi:hypothetical protein